MRVFNNPLTLWIKEATYAHNTDNNAAFRKKIEGRLLHKKIKPIVGWFRGMKKLDSLLVFSPHITFGICFVYTIANRFKSANNGCGGGEQFLPF